MFFFTFLLISTCFNLCLIIFTYFLLISPYLYLLISPKFIKHFGDFLIQDPCIQGFFLLENGAQTDLQDQDGMTAFAVATVMGKIELCKLLIEYNAKIDIANNFG